MRAVFAIQVILVAAFVVAQGIAIGQRAQQSKPRRARPPKFDAATNDVFFDEASKALTGVRPDFRPKRSVASQPAPGQNPSPGDFDTAGGGVYAWSKIISADTIEDEIKRINTALATHVTTPGKFKSGGYKQGRLHFSMLAVLFAVAGEYDGDIRWKQIAPGARKAFARAGFNCKVGTIQAYNEAKARKTDLAELVRGGSVQLPKAEARAKWGKVANRPPLMVWLEILQQKRLSPWTANAGEFKKNQQSVLHDAQLVAALADVISREGYESSDDEGYAQFCKQLKKAALEAVDATKRSDAASVRKAVSAMGQACSACHEEYRG